MSGPRLELRLDRIRHNAATLVSRLAARKIAVTGVTKVTLGSAEVARELLQAGVRSLGESRIENVETLRHAGITAPMTLIRSPMLSQVDRVVEHVEVSLNSELTVLAALSAAAGAQGKRHGVVLMVELGDLREGILPGDVAATVRETLRLPSIDLVGIGTNLACQSGVTPDARNMAELSSLATSLESTFGVSFDVVSGGNSANLDWALGSGDVGLVNDLRLGEAILLGRETLRRRPVDGLHTDAITLVAEVIEAKVKPTQPWGEINQAAFGASTAVVDRGTISQAIVALGRQDVDPAGLGAPPGMAVLGASSDHLVLDTGATTLPVGSEVRFAVDYSALLAAMTSPFVGRVFTRGDEPGDGPSPAVFDRAGAP
ncbi:MAG TPA: alanine/ornithine racemase family PLP-dependent enzyme [Acidimicrobiales bacterium]|nr:alanine/ornithine racemase family PLP-dependent enzyme [Acidimicrobiales bacterium]